MHTVLSLLLKHTPTQFLAFFFLVQGDLSCQPNPRALNTTKLYLPLKEPGYEQHFHVQKVETACSVYPFLLSHSSVETFVLSPLGSVLPRAQE